jgi:hypothetical protein
VVVALMAASPLSARAQSPQVHGVWSDTTVIGLNGSNVAVLRDPDTDTTRVLLFGGSGPNLKLAQWAWWPGYLQQRPVPGGGTPTLFTIKSTYPITDIFCSGMASTSQGKLIITGGQHAPGVGTHTTYIWDPGAAVTDSLIAGPAMAQERWYPSNLALDDGSLVSFAGSRWAYGLSFGGTDGEGLDDFRALALGTTPGTWKWWDPQPTGAPEAREDHAAGVDLVGQMFVIGGDDNGTTAGGKRIDAWRLYRTEGTDGIWTDSTWAWVDLDPDQDPTNGYPAARSDHSVIVLPDTSLVIYGGVDGDGEPLEDVWRLDQMPSGSWQWERVMASSDAGARYGHTATYFPAGGNEDPEPRMVVFGGWDGTAMSAATTWSLTLSGDPGEWAWEEIVASGSSPAARYDHAVGWDIDGSRIVLFGGRDLNGLLDLTAWRLSRSPTTGVFSWAQVATPEEDDVYGKPAKRHRHAAMYDKDWNELTIFGGDTSATSPLRSNEVWALSFRGGTPHWRRVLTASSPTPPAARAGHTFLYDVQYQNARVPERYTVGGGANGAWSSLGAAHFKQVLYPFMFQLPDRQIIYAGPWGSANYTDRYLLDPDDWTWDSNEILSSHRMGSAVMYRPGRIMRCGALSPGDGVEGHNKTDILDYDTPSTSSWDEVASGTGQQLLERSNHNLTMLPTGQVLVTGGLAGKTTANPEKHAQIWTPTEEGGSNAWTGALAEEPVIRNYHSCGILLPDGRVMTSGGEDPNAARFSVSVYSPPYLFDANGDLAQRPPITDYKHQVGYGQTFTVCVDSDSFTAISHINLVRPGAVTHGFNQDQRFVPLAFTRAFNPTRFLVTAPAHGAIAPPGDYLLFVLDSTDATTRVPSVGQWIRLDGPPSLDLCDAIAPAAPGLTAACVPGSDPNAWELEITAPADDGTLAASGPAAVYDIRYSTAHITAQNFGSATPFSSNPTPVAPGTTQSYPFSVSERIYIRMKARDDNDQWSAPSIEVTAFPLGENQECGGMFGGGGGGGGSSLRGASTAAAVGRTGLENAVETAAVSENTVLQGRAATQDMLRLTGGDPTAVTVRLRSSAGASRWLDRVAVRAIDRDPDQRSFALGGEALAGVPVAGEATLRTANGTSEPELAGSAIALAAGDTLEVAIARTLAEASEPVAVLVEAAAPDRVHDAAGGLAAEQRSGEGDWESLGRLDPRTGFDDLVLAGVTGDAVRLVSHGQVQVRFAGHVRAGATATAIWATLAGDPETDPVVAALATTDSAGLTMSDADTVALRFTAAAPAEGRVRDWHLVLEGAAATPGAASSARLAPRPLTLPTAFALHPSQPNPFADRTTLRFDLPVGANVRLAIYDLQGRLRQVVAERWFAAGSHALAWDGRGADGASLGPGIYFAVLEAGSFHGRRKIVRLP